MQVPSQVDNYVLLSNSPAATYRLGKRVGKKLGPGSFLALVGELGCGKTLFTRGLCDGLGVPARQVNSPTFILVNEYTGRLPVFHMDLYRMWDMAEGFEIGMLDYLVRAGSGVMVVEWAEKIPHLLPDSYLEVRFEVLSVRERRIALSGVGEKYHGLIKEISR